MKFKVGDEVVFKPQTAKYLVDWLRQYNPAQPRRVLYVSPSGRLLKIEPDGETDWNERWFDLAPTWRAQVEAAWGALSGEGQAAAIDAARAKVDEAEKQILAQVTKAAFSPLLVHAKSGVAACECGAVKTGVDFRMAGHSPWCPAR